MIINSEIPKVLAFSEAAFRRAVKGLKKRQVNIVLQIIKEAFIFDQNFSHAAEIRAAQKEFLPPNIPRKTAHRLEFQ